MITDNHTSNRAIKYRYYLDSDIVVVWNDIAQYNGQMIKTSIDAIYVRIYASISSTYLGVFHLFLIMIREMIYSKTDEIMEFLPSHSSPQWNQNM